MILAGDIGGTKTNIAIFDADQHDLGFASIVAQQSFSSADYDSLEAIIKEFVTTHKLKVTRACFGVAGPVFDQCIETPNLKWTVCESTLIETLRVERVQLINDLEATAFGIEALGAHQLHTLNEGDRSRSGGSSSSGGGTAALIAAGTGLGMAGISISPEGTRRPLPSEGGHADFAPRTEIEIELLRHLIKRYDEHVSYERVLSGTGFFNIYTFLRDKGFAPEPDWLAAQTKADDKRAAISAISAAALTQKSELAAKALEVFVSIYGAAAGNLALVMKAADGIFIGGGIAPKIIGKLADGTFMRSFVDKGRLTSFLEKISVRVILDDKTALYGAARYALAGDRISKQQG